LSDFYERYLCLCRKANKTPTGAAIEIGLNRSAPNSWKNGGNPTDATIQKIADYFGVKRIDLLKDPTPKWRRAESLREKMQQSQSSFSCAATQVAEAYEKATPEIRNAVRRVLGLAEEPPAAKDKAT